MNNFFMFLLITIMLISCNSNKNINEHIGNLNMLRIDTIYRYDNNMPKMLFYQFSDDKYQIQIDFFENNKIKNKIPSYDGMLHGEVISYFQSGQIHTVHNYHLDTLNGEELEYYNNGDIKRNRYYKMGLQDSIAFLNLKNHNSILFETWNNNKKVGSVFHYNNNMDLREYAYLDKYSNPIFIRHYNTDKSIKGEVGSPIYKKNFNKDYYNINDTLKLHLHLITPPFTSKTKLNYRVYVDTLSNLTLDKHNNGVIKFVLSEFPTNITLQAILVDSLTNVPKTYEQQVIIEKGKKIKTKVKN